MKFVNVICKKCGKSFDKPKNEYDRQVKNGRGYFLCNRSCSAGFGSLKLKIKNETEYLQNPKTCINCKSIILYNHRNNRYCTHKCASLYSQKNGGNRQYTDEDKKTISDKIKKYYEFHPELKKKINQRNCKECGTKNLEKRKQTCKACQEKYYRYYRPLCEFGFDVNKYPDEFDFEFIKKHGRYSPKNKGNNLLGVSRDHLYCVKDGFKNKVNPDIIKHPANCKFVIHKENQQKYNTSSISLDDLLKKISEWNKKYED